MKKIIISCLVLLSLALASCEDFEGGLTKRCICYEINYDKDTVGTTIINKKDYGIHRTDGCLKAEWALGDECDHQYRVKCNPYK